MFRRSRLLPGTPKVPFTPGEDVVGIVDKLGEGVSEFESGQRVAGGTFSLGVGTAPLELGKLAGLEMYGTASKHNHDLVSSLGATPFDYRTDDFVERVRSLTKDGVDVAFDPVGGRRQLWRSYRALRKGGRLVWFGVGATKRESMRVIPVSLLVHSVLRLLPDGKYVATAPDAGKCVAETLAELLALLAEGRLKPVVAARVPLVDAARAHELLERGRYAGRQGPRRSRARSRGRTSRRRRLHDAWCAVLQRASWSAFPDPEPTSLDTTWRVASRRSGRA